MKNGILASVALAAMALVSPQVNAEDMASDESPLYVSVFGGASFLNDVSGNFTIIGYPATSFAAKMNTGYLLGGAIGTSVTESLRAELELSHASWSLKSFSGSGGGFYPLSNGSASATYLLGNLWFDVHNATPMTPYLGGGVGIGFGNTVLQGTDYSIGSTFAYQFGGGLKYDISNQLLLDAGYRYKAMTGGSFDKMALTSHNIQIGLTYQF